MKKLRSLLFYAYADDQGISPNIGENLRLGEAISKMFNIISLGISIAAGKSVPEHETDHREGYDFFSWDLQPLRQKMKVGRVPKPGIVFAIKRGKLDTALMASIVKGKVEHTSEEIQQDLLKSFLSGPKGQFDPAGFWRRVARVLSIKVGPISLDLGRVGDDRK